MPYSPSDKPDQSPWDSADEHAPVHVPEPPDPSDHEAVARHWLKYVYVGDRVRQLSFRAVLTGMLIGGVMSISNLYVGLKSGWGLGVTITACIIAYAVFKLIEVVVPPLPGDEFSILENYTMSSAASAAGYMASAGLVSAIPALTLVTGRQLLWWEIMAWLAAVSFLGVFMAIPLKRQLINIDQLPFPSGIATAETLRSMHTAGRDAILKGRALAISALAGMGLAIWRDGFADFGGKWAVKDAAGKPGGFGQWLQDHAFPTEFPLLPAFFGSRAPQAAAGAEAAEVAQPALSWGQELLEKYTLGIEGSFIMIAAGAIMGIRVGCSLLLGTILYYGLIAPVLVANAIVPPGYKGIVSWTLWPATALMVTSGLLSFAFKWRTVLRAFSGLTSLGGSRSAAADPLASVEVPGWWFATGTLVSGAACVILGTVLFEIPWYMGILAVLLTFLLSIVAARATGETDITPNRRHGQDHPAHLRSGRSQQPDHQPHDRRHHLGSRFSRRRSAHRPQVGLPAGWQSPQADHLATVRRDRRDTRLRAGLHGHRRPGEARDQRASGSRGQGMGGGRQDAQRGSRQAPRLQPAGHAGRCRHWSGVGVPRGIRPPQIPLAHPLPHGTGDRGGGARLQFHLDVHRRAAGLVAL